MKRPIALWLWMTMLAVIWPVPQHVHAGYKDLMGFPELQAELGAGIPTGAGIGVMLIEAPVTSGGTNYRVDTTISELSGKTINHDTAGSTSSHAGNVARNFFGNTTSIAPGINTIDVFNANNWIGSSFLRTTENQLPLTTTSRIANHSWIGNSPDFNSELLRRFDYLVDQDDFIQVAGVPNSGTAALWRTSYNAITVGLTNNSHSSGTTAVDSLYTSGRVAPTIVTPGFRFDDGGSPATTTSWATPMVSAGVALLLETGQDAGLSNGSISNRTRTIRHAETSEVIKAVLMAGADREVINPRGASLVNYTINTSNNLDSRYGAGQMNIYNSYKILTAGEQEPGSIISTRGWDYNPAFGGANSTATMASYFFTPADLTQTLLTASLVWNLDVEITTGMGPSGSPTFTTALFDLNLQLIDLSDNSIVASSMSTTHNTENLWQAPMLLGRSYELRVLANGAQFNWDYGLAWQIIPEPGTGVLLLAFSVLVLRRRHLLS